MPLPWRITKESPGLNRRTQFWSGLAGLGLGWIALVVLGLIPLGGCDYSAPESELSTATGGGGRASANPYPELKAAGAVAKTASIPRAAEERTAILDSSITLIQRAPLQPGGRNFELAVKKLNQYFEGTSVSAYQLEPPAREYLATQLPPQLLKELENRNWNSRGDTRHIEDCMMYYGIATRAAGTGEDLARVRRVFDWVVRQVQLVPPQTLASGRTPQAFARPYDVLLRGMATEAEGFWAERSWLFMVLCRQLGIDTGLITYTRSETLDVRLPKYATSFDLEASLMRLRKAPKLPVVWICTALIDDKAYLFDARVGLEVPGPGGTGVATLDQALADPAILERMNLPGLVPYATSRASLLGSPTKIGILIDSSQGYFSPKMKLLQNELSGKNRTILYRDPAEQRDHFRKVLGDRAGLITLWPLPLEVETRLFTDAQFVTSIQASLFLFRSEFPLLYARIKQLRGELDEAIEDYVRFRFAENFPVVNNKKQAIPKEVQSGLDVYATYYLALAHLERNNLDQAELMFKKTLELLPEPGQNQPYYNMFRRGANANLGRINEARDPSAAIAHYTQRDPTPQYVGNLIRARELVWRDPTGAVPATLPAAPPPK
jgi:tetratricopeptide (TPR) repeat protein